MPTITIDVPDETALGPLARAVVAALPHGAFVALSGDLGAGKTTFVKAVAAVSGIDPVEVVSPTFGLIHAHDGPRGRFVHADLYRLPDVASLHETGWDDAVAAADCTLVEWPERITPALPPDRLDVAIAITGPGSRAFTFTSRGPRHDRVVESVARPLPEGEAVDHAAPGRLARARQVRPRLPLPQGEGWGEGARAPYAPGMRLDPATTLLAVIDVQDRLLAAIPAADRVVARCGRLAQAAALLDVRRMLTEQYPQGLGATPPALAGRLPAPATKMSFSCCGCAPFTAALSPDVVSVVLAGLETHVCVAQTALDLLARGLAVFVAVDAVASRHDLDHEVALRRLEGAGVVPTTTEAVLFEWCRSAEHPRFKEVRALVVDHPR